MSPALQIMKVKAFDISCKDKVWIYEWNIAKVICMEVLGTTVKSTGPWEEGPPGCEEFPLVCILFWMKTYCRVLFSQFASLFLSSLLFLQIWYCSLHVLKLLHTVWFLQWAPERNQFTTTWPRCLSLEPLPESHQESCNSKPVPKTPKVMQIGPKATKKHTK